MWDAKDVDALLTSGWETQPRRAGAFQWRTLRPLFDGREGGSSNKTAWCTDRSLSGCYQMETWNRAGEDERWVGSLNLGTIYACSLPCGGGCPGHCRLFGIPDLPLLDASSTSLPLHPSSDYQTRVHTLLIVSWVADSPPVENLSTRHITRRMKGHGCLRGWAVISLWGSGLRSWGEGIWSCRV